MKKKFSLWLNIATICLCVCAIAIGVYAAQSASLTVTGSIGFTANGIKYSAKVEALGYVTDPEDATTYKSTLTELTNKLTDATASDTLSLTSTNEKLYFTDLKGDVVPNIEIKITVTNNSKFDITVAPNTQSCIDVTITKTDGNIATKNGGSASITYTLALNKDETTGEYKELSATDNLSITIDLKKFIAKTDSSGNEIVVGEYSADEQSKIRANTVTKANSSWDMSYSDTDKSYAEEFPYYITMGKSTSTLEEEDLKWLIIGYNNDGTVASLTNEDKAALAGHRLIKSKNYVALSAEALEQREFHNTESSTNGINVNDYYRSDIRIYLTSTKESGFASTYSLTNPSITISPRKLSELYTDIVATGSNEVIDGTISTIGDDNTESDSFWLLSKVEVDTLFKNNTTNTSYASTSLTTTPVPDAYFVLWWLRSPQSNDSRKVHYIYLDDPDFMVDDGGYVRPAFQF